MPVALLQLRLLSGWLIALYMVLLWLSMLFVALPVAGHGFLGRRLGTAAWIEQLLLHMVFGMGLWFTLKGLK